MTPNGFFSKSDAHDIKNMQEGEWRLYLMGFIAEKVSGCNDYTDAQLREARNNTLAWAVGISTVVGVIIAGLTVIV